MAEKKKLVSEITTMDVDFAQWYTVIVKKAEMADYSSVKGCIIMRPYAQALWENIQHTLDGKRLVNVFGGLVEALQIGQEKMIEGLPQHGGTAAAPFDELPSGRLGCDAVKDMLQRQVFMPTPFQLLHRKA